MSEEGAGDAIRELADMFKYLMKILKVNKHMKCTKNEMYKYATCLRQYSLLCQYHSDFILDSSNAYNYASF